MSAKIVVVGSLNVDYFTRVDVFPDPGETVMGRELAIRFGGKGANQAVAARRLGAEVAMIGAVGDDEIGREYRGRLAGFGVDVQGVSCVDGVATGSAFITLDATGENTIVVAPGANGGMNAARVAAGEGQIAAADWLLLQNEIPLGASLEAIRIARAAATKVLYNPAPWREGFPFESVEIDLLVANALEMRMMAPAESGSRRAAELGAFPFDVVVTRGAASTLAHCAGQDDEVETCEVEVVDSVGAGDSFVGAMATQLASGETFGDALRFANAAAALATQKIGAQEAMPSAAEIRRFRETASIGGAGRARCIN